MIVCSVAFVKIRDAANAYCGGPVKGPHGLRVEMPIF